MTDFIRRIIDIFVSSIALVALSPVFGVIALFIYFSSPGGIFYCSRRIGKAEREFLLYKFRSMIPNADKMGAFCVSHKDNRVTFVGRLLRISKLDELPQFYNVLIGNMTLIGPRPDISDFVGKISDEKKKVIFSVKPGLSDWASLFSFSQYTDYAKADNPDDFQQQYIQPIKLALQEYYCRNRTLKMDAIILVLTALRMLKIDLGLPLEVKRIIDEQKASHQSKAV